MKGGENVKAYLRRVAISATALFLLVALIAPIISANDYTYADGGPAGNTADGVAADTYTPQQPVYKVDDGELQAEPEPEIHTEPAQGTEEISAGMPQEDEDPTSPDFSEPVKNRGKGNSYPQAIGFWRNLLRKVQ